MRARGSGAMVQLSSMGGQMSFAGFAAYSATKFALEGLSEALADETITALDAEQTPLRPPLGGDGVDAITAHLDGVRADLTAWEQVARATALS
jgi:short subunit dehydrogenase